MPTNEEPDLFSGANNSNSEIEVESNLNKDSKSEIRVYNASELNDNFTIPKLKKLANDLQIKIPKGITKKGDIIKIILSNQD